jgi:hypothetical protein
MPQGKLKSTNQRLIAPVSVLLEVLEAVRAQLGVTNCVLDIFVAEVELDRARVLAGIHQVKAGRVPEHVCVQGNSIPAGQRAGISPGPHWFRRSRLPG